MFKRAAGAANDVQGTVTDLTNYQKEGIFALTTAVALYQTLKANTRPSCGRRTA